MRLGFRSFRLRILVFVLGLLVGVQGAAFLIVNRANVADARRHVEEALGVTAHVFRRSLETRERILREQVRLLASDFAFKEAAATRDLATIRSALENHRDRVGAAVLLLVTPEGEVVADTLRRSFAGGPFPAPDLLEAAFADESGEAAAVGFLRGRPFQLVAVPLFTPEPSAWIAAGFAIDDAFARELREETRTHVSLLGSAEPAGRGRVLASTLPEPARAALASVLPRPEAAGRSVVLPLAGDDYLSLAQPLAGGAVSAVLSRSLAEALAPHLRLRRVLAGVFAAGVLLSLAASALLAARVTRPVWQLARAARRVEEGDYATPAGVAQHDELGLLASAFDHMMKGLAERDRVRSLLGKVVSPSIAEELLSRAIELGGEERLVTVLFSDVRGFSALSEREEPRRVVDLLNRYFTRASAIVERHGGVVDKYIGDALMAVFGAPLAHADDAERAVRAALEMREALAELNRELAEHGLPRLEIGIGVNTGVAVAGNMGSLDRLNYTVIGDAVNLASRIEGLTKEYGVGVLVSEATREACSGLAFRELARVQVRGRSTPVTLFEPVGT